MKEKTSIKVAKITPLKKGSQKKLQVKASTKHAQKKVVKAEKGKPASTTTKAHVKKNPPKKSEKKAAKKSDRVFSVRAAGLPHDPREEDAIAARPSESQHKGSPDVFVQQPLAMPHVSTGSLPIRDARSEWSEYQDIAVMQAEVGAPLQSDLGMQKSLRRKRQMRKVYAIRSILALFVLTIPVGLYGYVHSQAHPPQSENDEARAMLAQVRGAVAVPDGSVPQIFKVTDPQKLSAEGGAFADLKIGDRILYYKETRTLVLYSMEKKKIIAIRDLEGGSDISHNASDTPIK